MKMLSAPDGLPPLAEAASLALACFEHFKVNDWDEMAEAISQVGVDAERTKQFSTLLIADDQAELMNEHAAVLRHLSRKPMVTLAVCDTCDGWLLVSKAAPSRCKAKWGCTGTPVRATKARRPPLEEAA